MTPQEQEELLVNADELYRKFLTCIEDDADINTMFLAVSSLSASILYTFLVVQGKGYEIPAQHEALGRFARQVFATLNKVVADNPQEPAPSTIITQT